MKTLPPLLALPLALLHGAAMASTPVSGNVSGTWSAAGSPYTLVGSVTIPAGQSLYIEPLVTVVAESGEGITVNGSLTADGAPNQGIVFTTPDSLTGGWPGIYAQQGSEVVLRHSFVDFAGQGGAASLITTSGTAARVELDVAYFRRGHGDGVRINTDLAVLTTVLATNNAGDGIEVTTSGAPAQLGNFLLEGNGGYMLRLNNNPGHIPGTLVGSGNGFNAIHAAGTLGGNEPAGSWSWQPTPGTAIVLGNVAVGSDTLEVAPGCVVQFATGGSSLTLNSGALLRSGDAAPGGDVWFSSLDHDVAGVDTRGDGAATAPSPGDWSAIFLQQGAAAELHDSWFAYGGAGGANLVTTSGTATRLEWSGGGSLSSSTDGVRVQVADVQLAGLQFDGNAGDGLELTTAGLPPVLDALTANGNGGRAMALNNNPGHLPGNLAGAGNGTNGIYITGALGGVAPAGRWLWRANPGFPVVCNSISVASDSLEIEAGATVKMWAAGSSLALNSGSVLGAGTLVDGNSSGPVWFTALADDGVGGDTNGDGPSVGSPGNWSAVYLQQGSEAELDDCWFAFGGLGGANLRTSSGTATRLRWNGGGSLSSSTDGANVNVVDIELSGLQLEDNASDGLEISTSGQPPVLDALVANDNAGRALVLNNNPGHIPGNLSGAGNGTNGIYLVGTLGGTASAGQWSWRANPGFPVVCASLTVASDTLRVEAGSTVKLWNSSSSITLNGGALWQAGVSLDPSSTGPVWITALADDSVGGDSNGDGPSVGSPGSWGAVYLQQGSQAELDDCWFGYGGLGGANLRTSSGTATRLRWAGGGSVGSSTDGATVNVADVQLDSLCFDDNAGDGLEIQTSGLPPALDELSATGNGGRAFVLLNNPGHIPGNLSGSGNGTNGIYTNGALGGSSPAGTWRWGHSPGMPIVCANPSVSADTLEIEAGAVVKFWSASSNLALNSGAVLRTGVAAPLARGGGGGGPVWFTSLLDDSRGGDTNGDGTASSPAAGDWNAIYLQQGARAELDDSWLAYGGGGASAALVTTAGRADALLWDGGGSLHSASDGVRVNCELGDVRGCRFADNQNDGVDWNAGQAPTFTGCDFIGNGQLGLRWTSGPTLLASGNWWGDPSGPFHPSTNPGGLGQQVSDNVDYAGWAGSALTNSLPASFELLSPAHGDSLDLVAAGSDSVCFAWRAAADPDGDPVSYELQVNAFADFRPEGQLQLASGLADTTLCLGGFSPNQTYYWCVTASDGTGESASLPQSRCFATKRDPSATGTGDPSQAFFVARPAPNPFRASTTLWLDLPHAQLVELRVYDLAGRLVRTVVDGTLPAGRQAVSWDGRDGAGARAAAGVYFARVVGESGTRSQRLLLMR